jgi:DNA-binding FadR family transcriptional regulator
VKTPEPGSWRLAEGVARRLENEIIRRGWQVGEVIGSEGELIERMEVSRAVFREAVRIVEHDNVARMRRGPGGGLVVTEPDPESVQRAIAVFLSYAGVERQQLFETRIALEVTCATQAAERVGEVGVERLREVLELEEKLQENALGSGHTHLLHVTIARLTENPAMTLFVTVLTELTLQRQRPAADPQREVASYHAAHVAVAEAIIAGDPALAQHRMRRHLRAVADLVAEAPQDPFQPIEQGGAR